MADWWKFCIERGGNSEAASARFHQPGKRERGCISQATGGNSEAASDRLHQPVKRERDCISQATRLLQFIRLCRYLDRPMGGGSALNAAATPILHVPGCSRQDSVS
jgi:hypothetical protein